MEAFRNIKSSWVSMEQSSTECEFAGLFFAFKFIIFPNCWVTKQSCKFFNEIFNTSRRSKLGGFKSNVTEEIVKFLLAANKTNFEHFSVWKTLEIFNRNFPSSTLLLRLSRNFNKTCVSWTNQICCFEFFLFVSDWKSYMHYCLNDGVVENDQNLKKIFNFAIKIIKKLNNWPWRRLSTV